MKACRYACVLAMGLAIVQACNSELPKAETINVPPGLPPDASAPPRVVELDASTLDLAVDAQFIQGQTKITAPVCSRVFVVAAEGKTTTAKEVLETGDVMIVKYPTDFYVTTLGLALRVIQPFPCTVEEKPGPEVVFRRANQAPELTWGPGGAMHAHLDVGSDVSPDLYLGRLSGTLPVAEHVHENSIEILAAIKANGAFLLDGKPQILGPRQIVKVPKNTKHRWVPEGGSELVAIQMYLPPGPEQRFVKLDAEYKDAGSPRPDAGKSRVDAGARVTSTTFTSRPAWCPVEDWDSWAHRCLKAPPSGVSTAAPAPAPTPTTRPFVPTPSPRTSRPSWCAVEDWDVYSQKCLRPQKP